MVLLNQHPGALKGPDRVLTGQLGLGEVFAVLWELGPLDSRKAHNQNVPADLTKRSGGTF